MSDDNIHTSHFLFCTPSPDLTSLCTSPHLPDSCLLLSSLLSPALPSTALNPHLCYLSGRTTDVQTHRSWRRKPLHVPIVAFSCHRTNCCVSPARTTCPTALPRYKHIIHTHTISFEHNSFPSIYIFFIIFSGSSYAERRLVRVSSM